MIGSIPKNIYFVFMQSMMKRDGRYRKQTQPTRAILRVPTARGCRNDVSNSAVNCHIFTSLHGAVTYTPRTTTVGIPAIKNKNCRSRRCGVTQALQPLPREKPNLLIPSTIPLNVATVVSSSSTQFVQVACNRKCIPLLLELVQQFGRV